MRFYCVWHRTLLARKTSIFWNQGTLSFFFKRMRCALFLSLKQWKKNKNVIARFFCMLRWLVLKKHGMITIFDNAIIYCVTFFHGDTLFNSLNWQSIRIKIINLPQIVFYAMLCPFFRGRKNIRPFFGWHVRRSTALWLAILRENCPIKFSK